MTWFVWWVRTWFREHDDQVFELDVPKHDGGNYQPNVKVSRTCKKCGWHRSYWKYL